MGLEFFSFLIIQVKINFAHATSPLLLGVAPWYPTSWFPAFPLTYVRWCLQMLAMSCFFVLFGGSVKRHNYYSYFFSGLIKFLQHEHSWCFFLSLQKYDPNLWIDNIQLPAHPFSCFGMIIINICFACLLNRYRKGWTLATFISSCFCDFLTFLLWTDDTTELKFFFFCILSLSVSQCLSVSLSVSQCLSLSQLN